MIRLLSSRSHFVLALNQITEIKKDVSDNEILACAISARADFIVSGDKHLLELKSCKGISIITPGKFIALMNER